MLVPDMLLNIFRWLKVMHIRSIHKCIFVNKEWCSLAIPILWNDPFSLLRPENEPWLNSQYIHLLRTLFQGTSLEAKGDYRSPFEKSYVKILYPEEIEETMARVNDLVFSGYGCWAFPYPSYIRHFDSSVLASCIIHWKRCFVDDIISLAEYEEYFLNVVDKIQEIFCNNDTRLSHARIKITSNYSVKLLLQLWLKLMEEKKRPLFGSLKTLNIEYELIVKDSVAINHLHKLAISCNSLHRLTVSVYEREKCEPLLPLIVAQRNIHSIYIIGNDLGGEVKTLEKKLGTNYTIHRTSHDESAENEKEAQVLIKFIRRTDNLNMR